MQLAAYLQRRKKKGKKASGTCLACLLFNLPTQGQ
jgi:hypothetical protein